VRGKEEHREHDQAVKKSARGTNSPSMNCAVCVFGLRATWLGPYYFFLSAASVARSTFATLACWQTSSTARICRYLVLESPRTITAQVRVNNAHSHQLFMQSGDVQRRLVEKYLPSSCTVM